MEDNLIIISTENREELLELIVKRKISLRLNIRIGNILMKMNDKGVPQNIVEEKAKEITEIIKRCRTEKEIRTALKNFK